MQRGGVQYLLAILACLATTACYQPNQGEQAYVPKTQAVALMEDALAAVQGGDQARALTLLDQAIEVDPGFAALYRDRALLLAQFGRYDEAIASIGQAIERSDDPGEALLAKGIFLERKGDAKAARETYAEASKALVEAAPNPADDLRRRLAWATSEYLRGGIPGGVRAINDVLARYPEHPLVEMYKVRILADRRESLLAVNLLPVPDTTGAEAGAETSAGAQEEN